MKLTITIDPDNRELMIEGVRYSFGLFEAWAAGGIEVDVPFAIQRREDDGQILVERLNRERANAMLDAIEQRAKGTDDE